MNIVQSLFKSAMQPDTALHAGEVFNAWALYVAVSESKVICELMLNHTNDTDLKEMIEHFIADVETPLQQKLEQFCRQEGIPMSSVTGEKPKADQMMIPPGAKMTDLEIANLLVVKLEGTLNLCHTGLTQSLRDDYGLMMLMNYQHLAAQGFTLKKLIRAKGWLRVPPAYPFTPPTASQ